MGKWETEIGNYQRESRAGEKENNTGTPGDAENRCASVQCFGGGSGLYVKYEEVEMTAVDNDCMYSGGILGVLSSLE